VLAIRAAPANRRQAMVARVMAFLDEWQCIQR
jgi:hypothetical protein